MTEFLLQAQRLTYDEIVQIYKELHDQDDQEEELYTTHNLNEMYEFLELLDDEEEDNNDKEEEEEMKDL
jgi:hypothetical protein